MTLATGLSKFMKSLVKHEMSERTEIGNLHEHKNTKGDIYLVNNRDKERYYFELTVN